MNLKLFSLIALPLAIINGIIYHLLKLKKNKRINLVSKCLGTFIYVCSAFIAVNLKGENPFLNLVFWFVVVCMAADALLEIHFLTGMLTFGLAHALLIIWVITIGVNPVSIILWALALGICCFSFRRELIQMKTGAIPYIFYAALLVATFALSVPLGFANRSEFLTLSLGATCFLASDYLIAQRQLTGIQSKARSAAIMLLYWGALYLITATLWLI